jgi:hypothetical protein
VGVRAGGSRAAAPRTPHPPLRGTFSHKGRRKVLGNNGENAVQVLQNIVVPEAKNMITLTSDKAIALRIAGRAMLATICLDHELGGV